LEQKALISLLVSSDMKKPPREHGALEDGSRIITQTSRTRTGKGSLEDEPQQIEETKTSQCFGAKAAPKRILFAIIIKETGEVSKQTYSVCIKNQHC
jgi:hypothetical protein